MGPAPYLIYALLHRYSKIMEHGFKLPRFCFSREWKEKGCGTLKT